VLRCKCDPYPDGSGGDKVFDHIRLFPIREHIGCTYRIHEQILPAIKRAGASIGWTDIVVRHTALPIRCCARRSSIAT
jgi:hypothetical protein